MAYLSTIRAATFKWRLVLLLALVFSLFLGLGYGLTTTPTYHASATVLVTTTLPATETTLLYTVKEMALADTVLSAPAKEAQLDPAYIQAHTSVSTQTASYVLQITASATSPVLAAKIANTVAEAIVVNLPLVAPTLIKGAILQYVEAAIVPPDISRLQIVQTALIGAVCLYLLLLIAWLCFVLSKAYPARDDFDEQMKAGVAAYNARAIRELQTRKGAVS